jgi:hypothetical protein
VVSSVNAPVTVADVGFSIAIESGAADSVVVAVADATLSAANGLRFRQAWCADGGAVLRKIAAVVLGGLQFLSYVSNLVPFKIRVSPVMVPVSSRSTP